MANYYVSSVYYAAVAQFAISHAYSLGDYVRQLATPSVGNERVFKCTTAGTSGGSEPAWNLGNNATTTTGTATFTQVAGQEAQQVSGNWKAPHATMLNAINMFGSTGDTFYVSSDHSESGASQSFLPNSTKAFYISVVNSCAIPPTLPTDYQKGAILGTTTTNSFTLRSGFFKGIIFKAGTSTSAADIQIAGYTVCEDCEFWLVGTGAGRILTSNGSIDGNAETLYNCFFKFSATSQFFGIGYLECTAYGGGLVSGSSIPTDLVKNVNDKGCWRFIGTDFKEVNTALFNTGSGAGRAEFMSCKLHASVTPISSAYNSGSAEQGWLRLHACDDSTNNRSYRLFEQTNLGGVVDEIIAACGSGASDGTTTYSWKMTQPSLTVNYHSNRYKGPKIAKYIGTTGVSKTLTIEFCMNRSTLAKKNEFWLEIVTLEDSASPLATYTSSITMFGDTAACSTSTKDWTGGTVAARQNSHAYSLGDFIKLASNPGRLFICTTAGTSSGSEPGGYATAVDGDSITDGGTAVFKAMRRGKITYTWTPQRKGIINVRPMMNISNQTIYINPKIDIT